MKTVTLNIDENSSIGKSLLSVLENIKSNDVSVSNETPTEINSFEDALAINGTTFIPTFEEIKNEKTKAHHLASWQWAELAAAYNKLRNPNWKADYLNDDQAKYYAWCTLEEDKNQPSGFGLSYSYYDFAYTHTDVGVRHAFADSDDVIDALKKFGQIYITMQTN